MDTTEKQALHDLSLMFTPGRPGIPMLLEKYKYAAELLSVLKEGRDKNIPQELTETAVRFDYGFADSVRRYCRENGVDIITRYDECYPKKLSDIDCPPLVIYCIGDKELLSGERAFTIVGSRDATNYSIKVAERFAENIAAEGHTIISGSALGIDSAAHRGALTGGGKTIAVLGCGVFYDYPKGSGQLKADIVKSGAVISEYPPIESPVKSYFTFRNRIIAGLGNGVLVVQAGAKSGSINTANHAISQGKDVFVIPPADIYSDKYKGQSILIRDGAIPVFEPKDILMNI